MERVRREEEGRREKVGGGGGGIIGRGQTGRQAELERNELSLIHI